MKIAILPVGPVEANVLRRIRESINEIFPRAETGILKEVMELPTEAEDGKRKQYYSSFLLGVMKEYLKKTGADRILGVTAVDLYVPRLNFVFGEAELSGRVAMISLHRLKPEFYDDSPDQTLFNERAAKEAVHEIGHTLGLAHCSNSLCVMSFSNNVIAVDGKKKEFCTKCSKQLTEKIR